MSTIEAYQLGTPNAEYRLDRGALIFNLSFILLIGIGFISGSLIWAENTPLIRPSILAITAGAILILIGIILLIRTWQRQRLQPKSLHPVRNSPYLNSVYFFLSGVVVILLSISVRLLVVGLGFTMFGVAIAVLISHLRIGRLGVLIFDHGLTCIQNNSVEVMRWDDIDPIYLYNRKLGVSLTMQRRSDGTQITLDARLERLPHLVQTILDNTTPFIMAKKQAQLNRQESITFGPLTIDALELRSHKHRALLQEIDEVSNDEYGTFQIIRGGKAETWREVHVEDIPNLPVLYELLPSLLRSPLSN